MTNLVNLFSSNDNLIIIILMLAIIILMTAILLIDIKAKRQKQEIEEDVLTLNLNNAFNEEPNSSIENTIQIQEIKYVEEDEEQERVQAKIELENLKLELEKQELENAKEKVQETKEEIVEIPTIENTKNSLDAFEDEQEEKAIISVEELTKKADELYDQNEITQYTDEGNEPISIQELEALYKASNLTEPSVDIIEEKPVEKTVTIEETFTLKTEEKPNNYKFTSSPVISPVYGISESETKENSLDNVNLEQTANLEKLNDELKKVNEFLVAIKELKNKLQ